MMKTTKDNDVIDCTSQFHVEKETELQSLIQNGTIYDEDQTRQWRDWS